MTTDTITEHITTIDFGQTFEAMIAAGKCDWKDDAITARKFPIEGTGIKTFRNKLFHFDRSISSEDAVAESSPVWGGESLPKNWSSVLPFCGLARLDQREVRFLARDSPDESRSFDMTEGPPPLLLRLWFVVEGIQKRRTAVPNCPGPRARRAR